MLTHFCTNEQNYGPQRLDYDGPNEVECADCGTMWERESDSLAAYRKARRVLAELIGAQAAFA